MTLRFFKYEQPNSHTTVYINWSADYVADLNFAVQVNDETGKMIHIPIFSFNQVRSKDGEFYWILGDSSGLKLISISTHEFLTAIGMV